MNIRNRRRALARFNNWIVSPITERTYRYFSYVVVVIIAIIVFDFFWIAFG